MSKSCPTSMPERTSAEALSANSAELSAAIIQGYQRDGFVKVDQYFSADEITCIKVVIDEFHRGWIADNQQFYQSKAVNSAYLTSDKYLNAKQRNQLFQFMGSNKIKQLMLPMPFEAVAFMNSQLFFNPVNANQANYWHRDPQYHLSVDEQREALKGPDVVHCRIALSDEPGVELVPGTHQRFDDDEELAIRLELDGKQNSESLVKGEVVSLNKGDVLLFSANMIHRGLYGNDRLALDLLFCEALAEFVGFADASCLPDNDTLQSLQWPEPFRNTLQVKRDFET